MAQEPSTGQRSHGQDAERRITPANRPDPKGIAETRGVPDLIKAARKNPDEVGVLAGGEAVQLAVAVHKRPPDGSFWRVRNEAGWRAEENLFTLLPPKKEGDQRDYLLITPDMEEPLRGDERMTNLIQPHMLSFIVDARGQVAWWAINAVATHSWASSARAAMRQMRETWGMVKFQGQGYAVKKPMDDLGEPSWPKGEPDEWLARAFEGKIIDSLEHPVIKDLRGVR